MEKEGLSRALQFLLDQHLTVDTLITDRHKQISKFLCKKHPDITHRYDVWHIAKGAISFILVSKLILLTQRIKEKIGQAIKVQRL